MAEQWISLPIDKTLFANLDDGAIAGYQTAIENGFANELGGNTRFPGLRRRVTFPDNGRVYLNDLDGDLVAATSKGQVYRVARDFTFTNVTGVPVSGGRRVIITKTDRDLLMAAGGPIVRLRQDKTELLSSAAPLSTHVGWIDGITLATEINSGRFYHSGYGEPDQWDPLDTFSADGNPDNINSMIITPYREVMLGGEESVEQFERLLTGDVPFFRRWAVGDGVKFPYCVLFTDNALWTVNNLIELVRFAGQQSQAQSAEIGALLEKVDDWTDAWMGGYPDRACHIVGQKFIILQAPRATNVYGTKGLTIVLDYRNKKFFTLYGWNANSGLPARWPGWSHWTNWGKVFVGVEGGICELDPDYHTNDGQLQRWLIRTANLAEKTDLCIQNFRLRLVRGIGGSATAPTIRVRCSRDAKAFGPWITRSLGKAGETIQTITFGNFGNGNSFRWEISSADDCNINLIGAEVLPTPIGH